MAGWIISSCKISNKQQHKMKQATMKSHTFQAAMLKANLLVVALVVIDGNQIANPFTDSQKTELIKYHNILGWKEELQQYAQMLANNCDSQRPTNPQHGIAYYRSNRTTVDPIMFTRSLYQAFGMRYDYSAGKCINNDEDCINGFQMVWQQGGYVGCGRAKCEKMHLAVCAYTHKAVYHMRPFLVVPLSNGTPYPPCSVCTSEMNICVEELCCRADGN